MREGKISLSVLKRSIFKNITPTGKNSVGGGVGNDFSCTAIQELSDGAFVVELVASEIIDLAVGSDDITFHQRTLMETAITLGVNRLANSLYTAYALGEVSLKGVTVNLILPHLFEEESLKTLMSCINRAVVACDAVIVGGHTTVSEGAKKVFVSLSMTGTLSPKTEVAKVLKDGILKKAYASPSGLSKKLAGASLVIAQPIAMEGTLMMAMQRREQLCAYFRKAFVEEVVSACADTNLGKVARIASPYTIAMHDLSEGGVLGGLWEFAEHCGLGIDVDLKAIPILQETIELTEVCQLNPYELRSGGSMLIATMEPEALLEALASEGIWAVHIGTMVEGNAKVLRNGDELRYLDLPQKDAIWSL